MRVLIIADESFAARERSMLSRLEVGLADEGVRVVHAIPTPAAGSHHPEVFSQFVTYDEGMSLSRYWRAQRLVGALEELADGAPRPVDLIHAFGQGAWSMAAEAARQTGAGLILEIWSSQLGTAAGQVRSGGETPQALCLIPDAAMAGAIKGEGAEIPTRVAPWGVHTPPEALEVLREGRAPSVVVVASGRDAPGVGAALEGMSRVMAQVPDVMVFAEADAIQRAGAWGLVKRLGVSDRFTLASDLEARRDLALRADVLVLPEALGEHRTITLDAMAAGMVVVAAADPLVSVLRDGVTARLAEGSRAESWAEALTWALRERDGSRALGLTARDYVRQHRRASAQVAAVVDAYEWMRAGESIPFQGG